MLPSITRQNAPYIALGYVKEDGNVLLSHCPSNFQDFNNVGLHKFGRACFASSRLSPLCQFIGHIVGLSANPKMIWSSAGRIVTAMENTHARWDRAIVDYPAKAMSSGLLCGAATESDDAISTDICSARPQPTTVGLFNLLPKSCENRFGKSLRDQVVEGICSLHQSVRLIVCHALGSLKRKGISFSTL